MSATLNVGLLGLGNMGRNHLRILSMLRSVNIRFISDISPEARAAMSAQYDVPAVEDPTAHLEGLDALFVVTPTAIHADCIRAAAGKVPHLFVEKPLTGSLADTEAILTLIEERGTRVQVGYIERFNPAVQVLKRVTAEAGRVVNIDFSRTNKLSSRITDVDVITDLMIHDIDLALYINGPVRAVSAHGALQDGLIGFAGATLTHENGAFSRLLASRMTDRKRRLIEATCADRFVSCDLLRKEVFINTQSQLRETHGGYSIGSMEETVLVSQQEALLTEINAFVEACRSGDFSGVPEAAQDGRVMRVAAQIQRQILEAS